MRLVLACSFASLLLPLIPPAPLARAAPAGPAPAPSPRAPLPAGCDAPVYHALDFWVGAWNVTDADGSFAGTNVISRILGGCAVEEQWIDAGGHQGRSLFYVDRDSGQWRQVWVTDQGPMKEKREQPGAVAGSMRFAGQVVTARGPALDRTTLTALPDGTVRQRIEQSLDDGQRWQAWEGRYARMAPACATPEQRAFDFWLGDWAVTVRTRARADATTWQETHGSNHVSAILNEERFTAEDGKAASWSGHSLSVWVPAQKRWRQTWVDDAGNYLAFTGAMQQGEMILVGEPRPDGRTMRRVFAAIARDRLEWRWEATRDGKSWTPMMTIAYRRLQ
jgi:hypothetical protein